MLLFLFFGWLVWFNLVFFLFNCLTPSVPALRGMFLNQERKRELQVPPAMGGEKKTLLKKKPLTLVSTLKFFIQISKGRSSHAIADCYSTVRPLYSVFEISLAIENDNRTNNACLLFNILMSGSSHSH